MNKAYGFLKVALLCMFLVLALVGAVPQPSQAREAAVVGGHCDPTSYVCKVWPDGSWAPGTWHETAN